jgi:hypothetical protein
MACGTAKSSEAVGRLSEGLRLKGLSFEGNLESPLGEQDAKESGVLQPSFVAVVEAKLLTRESPLTVR